jgi:hypothetical protein
MPQPRRTLTDRQTADLIKLAALPPDARRRALMQLVQQAFSNWQLPLLQKWGLAISPQLLKVRRMPYCHQCVICCAPFPQNHSTPNPWNTLPSMPRQ